MNIAIVDDEPRDVCQVSSILKEYSALNQKPLSMKFFHNAEDLLSEYHPYAYTAIFMDIYMEGITGLAAAKKILERDRHAIIIFLTSSEEHMPEAFSMHVFDYISKPVQSERLFKVMDDIFIRKAEYDNSPKFKFSRDKSTIILDYSDITCIKTSGHNYLEVTDSSGKTYLARMTFAEVTHLLSDDPRFLVVLRGVLVNMEHVTGIRNGICHLTPNVSVPINVRKAKDLENIWQNYVFDSIRNERRERRNR